jgi:hypothetical protein
MIMRRWILFGSVFLAVGCNILEWPGTSPDRTGTSTAPTASPESECRPPEKLPTVRSGTNPARTAVDPDDILRWLCDSNVYDARNPRPGKTVRFALPVAIHPHGSAVILAAVEHYESATGGAVTFEIAADDPPIGITVIEGDAVGSSRGEPGCGNVTSGKAPASGHKFHTDPFGVFDTLIYLHLGSSGCDDETAGDKPESVAEHELAHALGLGTHFPGFTGDEGLSPNLTAVVTELYRLPPGTDMKEACKGLA